MISDVLPAPSNPQPVKSFQNGLFSVTPGVTENRKTVFIHPPGMIENRFSIFSSPHIPSFQLFTPKLSVLWYIVNNVADDPQKKSTVVVSAWKNGRL